MMLEKAIKLLKQYQGYEPMSQDGETLKHAFDLTDETVDTLLTSLRPVSREQVEKVWRGEWQYVEDAPLYADDGSYTCSMCGEEFVFIEGTPLENNMIFCPACGAAMTDEAVEMVTERLEALYASDT